MNNVPETNHNKTKWLTSKQHELEQRIQAIERDLAQKHSADFAEQVTERENDEVLSEIKQQAQFELNHVIQAIKRIEQGRYHLCSRCEANIEPARLEALPYTTFCIKCAQ